jgi:hypothetical protein
MKTPLRQRWALFVLRYSRSRIWPYFCLLLTLALVVLQFTRYAHVHFLLVMAVVTLMAYERLAFAELFAQQRSRIAELENGKAA